MIEVHRLNNSAFYINHNLIELVEALPDTVITLTTEKKYIVKESPEDITRKIIEFERRIHAENLPGTPEK